jgi:hypothetical protein
MFLRDYVDGLFYRLKPDKRKRKRFHDDSHFATGETTAPQNAPRWTKSGYNGSMRKHIVQKLNDDNDFFFSSPYDTDRSAKNKTTVSQESASETLDEKEQEENNAATDKNSENDKTDG